MIVNGYKIIEDGYQYVPSTKGTSLYGQTFGN